MNKVILIGRLTQEHRYQQTQSGVSILSNTIAVQRPFKNQEGNYEADFINFVAYRSTADLINKWFVKGDRIGLEGRWQKRNYTNQQGETRYVDELVVENIEFLQERETKQQNTNTTDYNPWDKPNPNNNPYNQETQHDPFASITPQTNIEDDDLPF